MDVIITHANADFDAFASQVAAQMLYPEAHIVLGRRVGRPVRDFLALHKDRFKPVRFTELDLTEVTRVILVDVRRADRLKEYATLIDRIRDPEDPVEVHIYDHHPATPVDLVGDLEVVEPVGSATTLLIEALLARDGVTVEPDTVEATLMAIGIHSDTGSLTYANTDARDAHALAWLLEQGASLKMINRYLSSSMSPVQRDVLSRILSEGEVYDVGRGVRIGIAIVPLERSVDNLAAITSQAMELAGHPALFALFPIKKKKVQVVARASATFVNVAEVLRNFGGGGHAGAGAAVVKKGDPEVIRTTILDALRTNPPRPKTVRDIMSSPVHTVEHDVTLEALSATFQTWRYTGMPVLRGTKLVGIISRRDVEAARRDGRLHLKVASCMAHHLKTIGPDDTLEDALALMVDNDIGRLPVLEHDHLVGILSRSDLIRILYDDPSQPDGSP